MPINTDKIIKELEKGSVVEQVEAYKLVKTFVTNSLQEEQKKKEEEASQLQSTLENINGK